MINAAGTTVSTIVSGGLVNNPRAVAVECGRHGAVRRERRQQQHPADREPAARRRRSRCSPVPASAGSAIGNEAHGAVQGPGRPRARRGARQAVRRGRRATTRSASSTSTRRLRTRTPASSSRWPAIPTTPERRMASGTSARFTTLVSLAYDPARRNLYAVDYGAHTLKQVTTTTGGTATTVVGDPAVGRSAARQPQSADDRCAA